MYPTRLLLSLKIAVCFTDNFLFHVDDTVTLFVIPKCSTHNLLCRACMLHCCCAREKNEHQSPIIAPPPRKFAQQLEWPEVILFRLRFLLLPITSLLYCCCSLLLPTSKQICKWVTITLLVDPTLLGIW